MKILSFDCANKSLAYSIIELNDLIECSKEIKNNIKIDSLENECKKFKSFKLIHCDVLNLFQNNIKIKDTTFQQRSLALKNKIKEINELAQLEKNDIVLIELQFNVNDKTRMQMAQLLYEYADYETHIIGASSKNTVNLSKNGLYNIFIENNNSIYKANKKHTEYNFISFINSNPCSIEIQNIKKKDDIADAFMQSIAWISKYKPC